MGPLDTIGSRVPRFSDTTGAMRHKGLKLSELKLSMFPVTEEVHVRKCTSSSCTRGSRPICYILQLNYNSDSVNAYPQTLTPPYPYTLIPKPKALNVFIPSCLQTCKCCMQARRRSLPSRGRASCRLINSLGPPFRV